MGSTTAARSPAWTVRTSSARQHFDWRDIRQGKLDVAESDGYRGQSHLSAWPRKRAGKDHQALVFPGQGAQFVGMGHDLYEGSSAAREVFEEVDDALGRPLSTIMFEGPEEELRKTSNAQPAIMAASIATIRALQERSEADEIGPSMVAGHSLGEYTAIAVSGALGLSDTARLVEERGRLMQEACELRPGTMAAIIGLDQMTVEEISRQTGASVSNINTAEQVVISGGVMAVARALDMASVRGARKAVPLRVAGAFHSSLMEPAREGLAEAVAKLEFRDPTVPIVANMTGKPITSSDKLRRELVAQVCECVQWMRSVEYMLGAGVSCFVEVGPGRALSGMIRRISRVPSIHNVGDMRGVTTFALS